METQIVKYEPTEAVIAKLKNEYKGLVVTDPESYKTVSAAISVMRSLRTSVEKRRVELKADALAYGKKVDSEAKRITALLLEVEEPLKAEKQKEDDRIASIKAETEAKEQARIDEIKAKVESLKVDPLCLLTRNSYEIGFEFGLLEEKEITSEEYQEFTHEANQTKAAYLAILNKAMIDRRQQEEDDIKRKVEDARLAAERFVQKAETEKLAEQAARIKEAQDKLDAERDQIEAEKQATEIKKKDVVCMWCGENDDIIIAVDVDIDNEAEGYFIFRCNKCGRNWS